MKKSLFLALTLMLVMGLGGLVFERTSAAQNSNSSTTMTNMGSKTSMGRKHRRHRRGHRRHRRGRMGNKNMNANK
jgi:hypothetical protein